MSSRPASSTGLTVAISLAAVTPAAAQDNSEGYIVLTLYLIFALLYLIPTFVAFWRRHPNRWVIFVINLVLGGTGLGWLGSLVWACMAVHRSNDPNGSHGGESGLNILANDVFKVRFDPPAAVPAGPPPLAPPPLPGSPAAQFQPDIIDRLERLKNLHDSGAIDDDQFKRMRDNLIAELG